MFFTQRNTIYSLLFFYYLEVASLNPADSEFHLWLRLLTVNVAQYTETSANEFLKAAPASL